MKILIIGGIARSLVNFRGPLIREMRAAGHEVAACAGESDEVAAQTLHQWGVEFFPIRLARTGMSPLGDFQTFLDIAVLMRRIRPDVVMAYTIKPVIWGGLAARVTGVSSVYSLITGLGYAFMEKRDARQRLAARVASSLYRRSLRYSRKVFFQNPDDLELFVHRRLVQLEQSRLLNGSGVDLSHFARSPLPAFPIFLLIGRMLADKGIREYVEATRSLRVNGWLHRALLVGATDPNPSSVSQGEIHEWSKEGVVDYRGELADVRPVLAECSVYVLPSYYREGTPRTVLEAMAMGRSIITTDAPGCRETVRLTLKGLEQRRRGEAVMEGENGFLVRPRNAAAVATAMRMFIDNPALISVMGQRSREIAEEKYDVHKVNAVMLESMGLL